MARLLCQSDSGSGPEPSFTRGGLKSRGRRNIWECLSPRPEIPARFHLSRYHKLIFQDVIDAAVTSIKHTCGRGAALV